MKKLLHAIAQKIISALAEGSYTIDALEIALDFTHETAAAMTVEFMEEMFFKDFLQPVYNAAASEYADEGDTEKEIGVYKRFLAIVPGYLMLIIDIRLKNKDLKGAREQLGAALSDKTIEEEVVEVRRFHEIRRDTRGFKATYINRKIMEVVEYSGTRRCVSVTETPIFSKGRSFAIIRWSRTSGQTGYPGEMRKLSPLSIFNSSHTLLCPYSVAASATTADRP